MQRHTLILIWDNEIVGKFSSWRIPPLHQICSGYHFQRDLITLSGLVFGAVRLPRLSCLLAVTLCPLCPQADTVCMWLDIPSYVGEGGNTDSCQNGCGGGRLDAGAYAASIWQAFRLALSLVISNILSNNVLKNNRSSTLTRIHQGVEFHNVHSDLHG